MQSLLNFLDAIYNWLADGLTWLLNLAGRVITAIKDILVDVACWVLDQFLTIAQSALGALDFSAFSTFAGYWNLLPAETVNFLGLIGFGYAMSIVIAAILIRLVLQLIPFTRLGS